MSLKLFRSTGFHSILAPGEARLALHPGWAVAMVAGWAGAACNAWLWQALAGVGSLTTAVAAGVGIAGAVGLFLSVFGWRRTFKPAATFALLGTALLSGGVWTQAIQPRALVDDSTRLSAFLPAWASLFGWQVPTLLVLLGVMPVLWLWNTKLRRLSGPSQLRSNLAGMFLWFFVASIGFSLLGRLANA
jgi:glucan phosphoethanolaminetransferase (alkaline phosphatase superfamily)